VSKGLKYKAGDTVYVKAKDYYTGETYGKGVVIHSFSTRSDEIEVRLSSASNRSVFGAFIFSIEDVMPYSEYKAIQSIKEFLE
jgi:hypothetical protein